MKRIFLLLVTIVFSLNGFSQAPAIQWQKCLGGTNRDATTAIIATIDGGYAAVGVTSSNDGDVSGNHGGSDCWVVKLSNAGVIQWQKCFGGSSNDYGGSILQTVDGGYILAGSSDSNDGDVTGHHGSILRSDIWVVKLDSVGTILWQKSFGGTEDDEAYSIIQTSDGGYAITGSTASNDGDVSGNHGFADYWVIKIDSTGILQWQECLGGTNDDESLSIIQTTDGGYIVSGQILSANGNITGYHGGYDAWVVKLDASGTIQWQKALGGTDDDGGYAIIQTGDGGYLMAGWALSNNSDVSGNHPGPCIGGFCGDSWIVKLTSNGGIQWQKCFGGSYGEVAFPLIPTADGGFIFAGYADSNDGDVSGGHGDLDNWIVRADSIGTLQWQKCLGGTNQEEGYSIIQTTDGGYIVAGETLSNDGDVSGNHDTTGTKSDAWIVKLAPDVTEVEKLNSTVLISLFPNPAFDKLIIENGELKIKKVELYNAVGEVVLKYQLPIINYQLSIDVSQLLPGIYFITITDQAGNKVTKKVVKM